MKIRLLMLPTLGALLLGAHLSLVFAGAEPDTIFSRLEEADAREHRARSSAQRLAASIKTHDVTIGDTLEELDITRRATLRLQQDLIMHQIAWERAERTQARGAHDWSPGTARDVAYLMRHAAPMARKARKDDHQLVSALDVGRERIEALVNRQSSLIVELAQQQGMADAASASHSGALANAKKASAAEIDRDLRKTDEELARELALMLKNPSTRDFHRLKGTLVPPVRSDPTHSYGPRKQRRGASYVRHTGYTYAIPEGTEVRSVADGLVVYAERFEGFGRMIIIDHGNGYHSLYAHLDEMAATPGQRVGKNVKLGTSGASGSLEGAKLYFELRHEGLPIDPQKWFIRQR